MRTISDRLSQASSGSFVGRAPEMALLGPAVVDDEPPFVVGFVHGPGGIGKSSLLTALAAMAAPDVTIVRLDCRDVEPTPRGFLGGLSAALGMTASGPTLDGAVRALEARGGRTVLMLDTYEVFGLLDTWLRQVLLPALPASMATIVAGRERPNPAWLAGQGWAGLAREVQLGPLEQADAIVMLRNRGLGELEAARTNAFARGHPLALELAAAAVLHDQERAMEQGPPPAVLVQLLDALFEGLPEEILQTVEAASVARRVTEPVLRALLGRENVRDAFAGMQRLPFVERTAEGLLIHDLVRETVSRDLAERDPEGYAAYRRRAWGFFSTQARHPRAVERLWQVTADLIYLIRNPVLRTACFPEGSAEHLVEPATAADGDSVRAIADAHDTPEARAMLASWWDRHPGAFSVARGHDGRVAAFVHVAEMGAVDPEILRTDPVAAAWVGHLARVPPRRGDHVLMMRRWLGLDSGELLSPAVGVCWLDVKRVYMELRPELSRLYSVMVDVPALAPIFVPLGFAPIGDPIDLGGRRYQPVWLDFGEGSVDGWLSRLVDAEIDAAEGAVGAPAVSPVPIGELSARELQVLGLVAEGLSNRSIAARLVISEKTAGRHVANIFTKLGVHNRAQATRIAVECGLTAGAHLN